MKKYYTREVKRVLSAVLIFVVAFNMMGCNKGEGDKGKSNNVTTVDDLPEETGTPNEWGWVVPEETLEFTVYAGEGDQNEFITDKNGGKKAMDDWLLENMNVKITVDYYNNDMTEKLNLMLASGDYPDVITWMSDDMANKFISQERAVELTPYIEKYGDNITRRLGNYMNLLKSSDGTISKFAHNWGENANVAGNDFGTRYDYWKELGESDIYKTPQEYFEVMKKILKNHPTNVNGQTTYAFTSDNMGENFLKAMLGAYGFINNFKVDDNGQFTHWLNTEEGLEIAKLMNQCYLDNMIDPDYMSNKYEQVNTKMTTEQILGNLGTWWYAWTGGHQYWEVQESDQYNNDKRFMNVSVVGGNIALDDTSLVTSNYLGNYRAIITDKCKNVEGVVKFINWQNSELGNFISAWGIPSEENVWNITEDGQWKFDNEILNPDEYPKQEYFHDVIAKYSCNNYCLSTNMAWLKTDGRSNFDMIDPNVTRVSAYDFWPIDENGNFASEGINKCWQYYTAPAKDITLNVISYDSEAEVTIIKQTIEDTIKTEWNKMITAKSQEECEEIFLNARENCNAMGLDEVTAYNQQEYEKNLEILEGE